jgi:tetratricopeptide (TPR) repeat protein
VEHAVLATASELFEARHYPGVVALVSDALDAEPDCVPLLLVRARAHIGLRRDLDAQADLRDIIRLDPQCGIAYRLLGELAARRDENESAAIFFREALRLDPTDHEASDWLAIVESSVRPAAVANKLPAPAAAAGRFPSARGEFERGRTAQPRSLTSPARRFALGTHPPDEERPTKPFAGQRSHLFSADPTPTPEPLPPPPRIAGGSAPSMPKPTMRGAQPLRRPVAQPRASVRELPGFGEYLVSTGILTRERLRAAQAYQRSMKVQLSTAIVTLGLATPQRIEWAAVAHQAQLREQG